MKKKILMSIISIAMALTLTKTSYAAIEIVPSKNGNGTDQIVNTTVSNSYLLCQTMNAEGESLYGTTVVPHLATNKDWGAVSYLSNSIYGTNTEGQANGVQVTIDDVKYYSTTTNITGVMNWGSNPNVTRETQTAGLFYNYDNTTSTASSYVTELYKNKDTRFVDIMGGSYSQKGMAGSETAKIYGTWYEINPGANNYPISIRLNMFALIVTSRGSWSQANAGNAVSNVTFRPVIWNK